MKKHQINCFKPEIHCEQMNKRVYNKVFDYALDLLATKELSNLQYIELNLFTVALETKLLVCW